MPVLIAWRNLWRYPARSSRGITLNGIDPEQEIGVLPAIGMNREEHITFLFSTYDKRVIDRARRVITLVDGSVAEDTGAAH